ncbi:hypothetical protein SAMN04488589_0676 [Methanolobus vulcani]|uniref:Uncharacterized protein n=1 Tax=Methanolobus vulcani TaxID=38026 RepID=A0A7Z7FBU8_9EURY|nr:hypothetical protein [Methanolobus vulcani]SDF48969.1 hypothetical protein SAMN04488589_0676 [Methanolobus vulcani]
MTHSYGNKEIAFAALAGVLYVFFGLLNIAEGLGIDTGIAGLLFVPGDILGGFCLMVIGAVFLNGLWEMHQGINAGVSFVYVGILMSLIFAAVYLLIMAGNLLDSFIVPDDYKGWSIMETFRPGIYLGLLSIAGILYWKNRFSLNEVLVFREGA